MANCSFWSVLLMTSILLLVEGKQKTPIQIRVTTGDIPTVLKVVPDSNGNLVIGGGNVLYHFVEWLKRKLNFEYTITRYYRTNASLLVPAGNLKNGSWDGVMGDLTRDVADLAVGAFGLKAEFVPYADVLVPWTMSTYSMYVPYPSRDDSTWGFLKPFSATVWLLLLLSVITVSLTIWVILLLSWRDNNVSKSPSYDTILMSLIAVLSAQGGYWNYQGRRQLALGLTWCCTALVLVNAYNGLLTSYLTITTPHLLITSLEDLASKPDVKFFTFTGSWSYYTMMKAETGARKVLKERLLGEAELLVAGIENCMDKVEETPSVCFMESIAGDNIVQSKFKRNNKCTMTFVERGFLSFDPSFLMRKNHSLFHDLNQGMMWINDYGLRQHWMDLYSARQNCKIQPGPSTNKQKISVRNLAGPFLMLLFGNGIAVLVFICEIAYFRYKKTGMLNQPNRKPSS